MQVLGRYDLERGVYDIFKKVSLSEVNQSIETPNNNRFWQNLKAFLGPGALVAVGSWTQGTGLPVSSVGQPTSTVFFCHLNFIFNRYAVATNGWKIRDCDSNGPGSSNCIPLAQMATIHALGDSGACLNGDGLGRGAWFCHRT